MPLSIATIQNILYLLCAGSSMYHEVVIMTFFIE